MFQAACRNICEAVYGVRGRTPISTNQANVSTGTGFMIAPGVLATAAHVVHFEGNPMKPVHQSFDVIRGPDIGQKTEPAQFIAEDIAKDIALVLIPNSRSNQAVVLEPNIIPIGTSCGSLGFPLSGVDNQGGFRLDLRFQGAFISSFNKSVQVYEIDHLMYSGSSGCPIFTVDGTVFAMQDKSITGQPSQMAPPQPQSRQQRRQQMRQMQKLQAKNKQPHETDRLAISICVPSPDILTFAIAKGVPV